VAGEPVAGDILKCRLKRLDSRDYKVRFTSAEWIQLKEIFPHGVCDWSKLGSNQVKVVPWPSFGPSPDNRIQILRPPQ
jgi:hypothetical protein